MGQTIRLSYSKLTHPISSLPVGESARFPTDPRGETRHASAPHWARCYLSEKTNNRRLNLSLWLRCGRWSPTGSTCLQCSSHHVNPRGEAENQGLLTLHSAETHPTLSHLRQLMGFSTDLSLDIICTGFLLFASITSLELAETQSLERKLTSNDLMSGSSQFCLITPPG